MVWKVYPELDDEDPNDDPMPELESPVPDVLDPLTVPVVPEFPYEVVPVFPYEVVPVAPYEVDEVPVEPYVVDEVVPVVSPVAPDKIPEFLPDPYAPIPPVTVAVVPDVPYEFP